MNQMAAETNIQDIVSCSVRQHKQNSQERHMAPKPASFQRKRTHFAAQGEPVYRRYGKE